jgi:hypothetical protein
MMERGRTRTPKTYGSLIGDMVGARIPARKSIDGICQERRHPR